MDKASEAILALKPVTFRYKHEIDPKRIPQFGLVAEEVEKVNPDLVTCDATGEIYTVRYEAINAMLLNEFLKEHCKVEEQGRKAQQQETTITDLGLAMAQQQKQLRALTASVKEQAAQLQEVNAQIEMNKPAPQTLVNNR
jgi:methyl-accepting chemotaxis protein